MLLMRALTLNKSNHLSDKLSYEACIIWMIFDFSLFWIWTKESSLLHLKYLHILKYCVQRLIHCIDFSHNVDL